MDLRVNRDGELPLGTRLTWKLRSAIASGELRAGARLPSVRGAAAAAGVNVNTVRAVYGRLEREGLVSERAGQGTFVSRAKPTRARPRRARPAAPATGPRLTDARGGPGAPRPAEQIAALEAELTRLPPPPSEAQPTRSRAPAGRAALGRGAHGRPRRPAGAAG